MKRVVLFLAVVCCASVYVDAQQKHGFGGIVQSERHVRIMHRQSETYWHTHGRTDGWRSDHQFHNRHVSFGDRWQRQYWDNRMFRYDRGGRQFRGHFGHPRFSFGRNAGRAG